MSTLMIARCEFRPRLPDANEHRKIVTHLPRTGSTLVEAEHTGGYRQLLGSVFCSNLAFKNPQSVRKDCQEAFFCVRKGGGTRADYECKQIRMERRHMFRQEMG